MNGSSKAIWGQQYVAACSVRRIGRRNSYASIIEDDIYRYELHVTVAWEASAGSQVLYIIRA